MIDDHGQGGKPPHDLRIRHPRPHALGRTRHSPPTASTTAPPPTPRPRPPPSSTSPTPPPPPRHGRPPHSCLSCTVKPTFHRDAVIVERIGVERHTSQPIIRQKILVTPRYKLAHYGSAMPGELYDLETDPEEFTNLWNDPAPRSHPRPTHRTPPHRNHRRRTRRPRQHLSPPAAQPFRLLPRPRPPPPHRVLPPPHPQSPPPASTRKKTPRMLHNEHLAEQRQQSEGPLANLIRSW